MSTIYRVINKITSKERLVGVTEDFEKLCNDFETGAETENKALNRSKRRDLLLIERLEDTYNVPERFAYYVWPQTKRVEYSDDLKKKSLNKHVTKYLIHSVDRIIDLFPEMEYSFKFWIDNSIIFADVYKDGIAIERYTFAQAGTPNSRTILI